MENNVLAFKTDTVWGFGAHPKDDDAIKKIYEIKKRDSIKPLILMSDNIKYLEKYVQFIPDYAYDLIKKHLPGGLTLIFKKTDLCSDLISANKDTIGIRIPNSEDFFNIVRNIEGHTLATTSCNVSGQKPVETYEEACKLFSNKAQIIKPINDAINLNIPSTVILCEDKNYKILRQGAVIL